MINSTLGTANAREEEVEDDLFEAEVITGEREGRE